MTADDFFKPDVTYQNEILVKVTQEQTKTPPRPVAETRGLYRRGAGLVAVASFCAVSYTANAGAVGGSGAEAVQIRIDQGIVSTEGQVVRAPPDIGQNIDRIYQRLATEGETMTDAEYRDAVLELRNLQAHAADWMEAALASRLSVPRTAGRELVAEADRLLDKYEDPSSAA